MIFSLNFIMFVITSVLLLFCIELILANENSRHLISSLHPAPTETIDKNNRIEINGDDGTIRNALNTMQFHRSMMNRYLCRSYGNEELIDDGKNDRTSENNTSTFPAILFNDEGSLAYQNWLNFRSDGEIESKAIHFDDYNENIKKRDNFISSKVDHLIYEDEEISVPSAGTNKDLISNVLDVALTTLSYLSFGVFVLHLIFNASSLSAFTMNISPPLPQPLPPSAAERPTSHRFRPFHHHHRRRRPNIRPKTDNNQYTNNGDEQGRDKEEEEQNENVELQTFLDTNNEDAINQLDNYNNNENNRYEDNGGDQLRFRWKRQLSPPLFLHQITNETTTRYNYEALSMYNSTNYL